MDVDYTVSCCHERCYATINLSPKNYEQLKRTGEDFYCPAGHAQHFTGKTDEQKQIDRLTRQLAAEEQQACHYFDQRETLVGVLRTCPLCAARVPNSIRIWRDGATSWMFADQVAAAREWMAEHLRTEHLADDFNTAQRIAAGRDGEHV